MYIVNEKKIDEMHMQQEDLLLSPPIQSQASSQFKKTKSILLIADNIEFSGFLKQQLEKKYVTYAVTDNHLAMEIATEMVPDLIISDLMNPLRDGTEFCRLIKGNFETSHIPFIILSTKDTLDSKIEGLRSGADFYFTKPLNTEILALTIQNIFLQQQKLKERYSDNHLIENTELLHFEKDKVFVRKLLAVVEKYIQSQDLDVEFLCNQLFISRTKLYQKIKCASNQSVGEFVRSVRLKKAIHIMTHEDVTISEVAERIGLPNISNFSRTFKKEFGKSPLQFIQSLKEQPTLK